MSTTTRQELFNKRDEDNILLRTLPYTLGGGVFSCMAIAFLVHPLIIIGVFGPVTLAFMVLWNLPPLSGPATYSGMTIPSRRHSWKARCVTWDMRPRCVVGTQSW